MPNYAPITLRAIDDKGSLLSQKTALIISILRWGLEGYIMPAKLPGGFVMCDNNVGVAKRLDLESISQDIAKLVKELDKEVEGKVQVSDLKKIEAKVHKIIAA